MTSLEEEVELTEVGIEEPEAEAITTTGKEKEEEKEAEEEEKEEVKEEDKEEAEMSSTNSIEEGAKSELRNKLCLTSQKQLNSD